MTVAALTIALAPFVHHIPASAEWVENSTINVNGGAYLIGHEFEHNNHQGAVLSIFGRACSTTMTDVDNTWNNLQTVAGGWNDVISSFNNNFNPSYCWTKHYKDADYNGAADPDYSATRSSMVSGMNDITSSLRYS